MKHCSRRVLPAIGREKGGIRTRPFPHFSKAIRSMKDSNSFIPLAGLFVGTNDGMTLCESLESSENATKLVTSSMLSPTAATFLKFAPPVASQIVYLAPLAAMKKFRENDSTGDVSCLPYAAMCVNGAAWFAYGVLKGDVTIIAPNISGFFFGLYYVKTYASYAPKKHNMNAYYGGIAGMTSVIIGLSSRLDNSAAVDAVGVLGCAVVTVMFGGPLGSIRTVLEDKNTNSLPVTFTLATFFNCLCWIGYGVWVIDDPLVWSPCAAGLLLSTAQIGLYAKYGLPKI